MDGDQGIEDVEKLWRASFDVLFDVLAPGSPYYIFGPQGGDLGLLLLLLRDSGLAPKHILIWAKNRASFSIGRLDYDYQHEPVVYGWRPGAGHPWYATEPQTSLLPFDRPAASRLHATMKPVDLLAYLIRNSAPIGGSVLDPFGGSGSTLIACEQTGRVAYLMEIDPHYVDVICKRFQDFTGTKPVLESTGEPHDFT
jgi:site-specific DNA-methyltransferase (adenine-specific)